MSNLDKLVEQLEDCANDGIPCEVCPAHQECLELWDNRVTIHCKVSNIALYHYSQKFKSLKDKKRIITWQRLVLGVRN